MRRRTLLAGAAALACTQALPPASPTPRTRVERILASLSLEEKVGQLLTIAFHGTRVTPHAERLLAERRAGGVILFKENYDDAASLRRLVDDLSRIAERGAAQPLFFPIDQEGGSVVRVAKGAAVLPGQMALAATPDPEGSVRRAAEITARELRSFGANWQLAPVADVNTEPRNPIIGNRAYGSDPRQAGRLVAAAVRAYDAAGILSCVKHFPGHGATTEDSHTGLPLLASDRGRLDRVELVPFKAAIDAGVPAVMTAHIELPAIDPTPGRPASLSPAVIGGLLRRDLGFTGLCVTDDLEMDALGRSGGQARAALAAVSAGADHALLRFDESAHTEAHRLLVDAARTGALPAARLDEAVRRVLAAKERGGILDRRQAPAADVAADRAAALELGRAAVTLLRNDGVLPLRGTVFVYSEHPADLTRIEEQSPRLWELIAEAYPRTILPHRIRGEMLRPDPASAVAMAREADAVVIATADAHIDEAHAALIRALAAARPTVLIAQRGPYDILVAPNVNAYLCTYDGREPTARAAVDILLGRRKPQGRLPAEIPGLFGIGAGMSDLR
ncbi:MAG TPA: glycoside hydrolase family 3 N-terminal domain-containing protein [Candidatus Limnocylindria bacterium]|nr:glycoside hydrolase family 3 N-terminal domain-containing protein [Candidatus Limnocylindria bacterium]